METNKRILLYGNSVILGAIGATLSGCPEFEVRTLNLPMLGAHVLDDVKPDILLFDLESPHSEAAFSLLGTNPRLLLIGISPDINIVKIWSGRQLRELSTQSLIKLIESAANDLQAEKRGVKDHPF